jgi:hypothetical protein
MHAATSRAWARLCCEGDGGAATSGLLGRPATWIPRSTAAPAGQPMWAGPATRLEYDIYSVYSTYVYTHLWPSIMIRTYYLISSISWTKCGRWIRGSPDPGLILNSKGHMAC